MIALLLVSTPPADSGAAEPAPPEQLETKSEVIEEEDEVICRTKLVSGQGFGQRNVARKICKTKAEWAEQPKKR